MLRRMTAVWCVLAAAWLLPVAGWAQQALSMSRGGSVVEFAVTQNNDCNNPGSNDQITILFSNAEVSATVPTSVFGEDIVAEFSFSARDARTGLTFRRRVSDRSFLNARFIRVVNAGGDGWCSGFLSLTVDGRPILTKVPMFPRKGNQRNALQDWNRDQWAGKTYWETTLASVRRDRTLVR
ncbi:MAG: hypothetical protein AB7N65_19805 [Vicinamibacterales bacterium]